MIDEYKVKDALETLIRAHEIKCDEKLFKAVKDYAKERKDAISSIEDLKMAREEAYKKEAEEDEEEEISEKEMLEENVYQKRVAKANKEANEPSEIPLVKVVKDEA